MFGLAGGLSLLMSLTLADAGISREDRIKAVLVFKLVKFVEWPASVMPENASIAICAFGESPVGAALALTEGQTLGTRQVKFRRINGLSSTDVANCRALSPRGRTRSQRQSAEHTARTSAVNG
ncbi:MAG: YfiR family protein [Betaproteobacteria bacterium]|nr:YfiR family protein [Betaproteobacteria bacterium]